MITFQRSGLLVDPVPKKEANVPRQSFVEAEWEQNDGLATRDYYNPGNDCTARGMTVQPRE